MEKKCPSCGAVNFGDAVFCEKCGVKIEKIDYCTKCGRKVEPDMDFCPACGAPLKNSSFRERNKSARLAEKINALLSNKNTKIALIAAVAVIAAITVLFALINRKPSFQSAFEDAGGKNNIGEWVSLSEDGKSLSIDTNPGDESDYYDYDATDAIVKINKALGLPDALYDKMLVTRAIDGRQTETYEDISVSWTYHPDYGLEIIYERSK